MWFEYPELPLLFLIACICYLYLVRNFLPVCSILVGSLFISLDRCHFCCICLFVDDVTLCFVLCFAFWMPFLFECPWTFLWFFLFLFRCDRLCGLVVRVLGYKSRGTGFDSQRYQIFWDVVGLERGPLSLVSTTEELLGRNSSSSGLENR
jgi:hypothetical protein